MQINNILFIICLFCKMRKEMGKFKNKLSHSVNFQWGKSFQIGVDNLNIESRREERKLQTQENIFTNLFDLYHISIYDDINLFVCITATTNIPLVILTDWADTIQYPLLSLGIFFSLSLSFSILIIAPYDIVKLHANTSSNNVWNRKYHCVHSNEHFPIERACLLSLNVQRCWRAREWESNSFTYV